MPPRRTRTMPKSLDTSSRDRQTMPPQTFLDLFCLAFRFVGSRIANRRLQPLQFVARNLSIAYQCQQQLLARVAEKPAQHMLHLAAARLVLRHDRPIDKRPPLLPVVHVP